MKEDAQNPQPAQNDATEGHQKGTWVKERSVFPDWGKKDRCAVKIRGEAINVGGQREKAVIKGYPPD